jgi:predicted Zn-dependent protease
MQLGLTEFQKIKQATPVSQNATINSSTQRIGQRIASVAKLPNAQWEFVVFDQPQVINAFCLPGGKVGIYTGILQITKDDAGLATVIGHEVAHATARHGSERMSEMLLTQMGGQLLGAALSKQNAKTQNLFLGVYGVTSQVGWVLPHSREQELEADRLGLRYMARAGYDPHAAVDFWKRFQAHNQQKGKPGWEFMSTHPLDAKRIAQLETFLPEAMQEYHKATGTAPAPTAASSSPAPR